MSKQTYIRLCLTAYVCQIINELVSSNRCAASLFFALLRTYPPKEWLVESNPGGVVYILAILRSSPNPNMCFTPLSSNKIFLNFLTTCKPANIDVCRKYHRSLSKYANFAYLQLLTENCRNTLFCSSNPQT